MIIALFLMAAASLDHSAWDALLRKYLNDQSRVDYARWKQQDAAALDVYLAQIAAPWPKPVSPEEERAALINAYNALTVRWILQHYPVPSIWKTKKPFSEARHTINGEKISLDAIETKLRKMGDPRIHAALVCAARSCPPLRREAYAATKLDAQLDDNIRQWLANPSLNTFRPGSRKAEVSMIFKWYGKDFQENGGTLPSFLARHAPESAAFLLQPGARIDYRKYHWGLNDTGPLGEDYSGATFYFDYLRNR